MGPGIPFAIVCASDVLGTIAEGNRETFLQALYLRVSFRDAADSLLQHLQTQVWAKGGSEVVRRAIEFERTRKAAKETPVAFQARRPEILATEFVALRYVAFIRYVMLQLRNWLTFLTMGFMAFALALISLAIHSRLSGSSHGRSP